MIGYNGIVNLRNDGVDPSTTKKDLNAAIGALITVRFATVPPGQGVKADLFDIDDVADANPATSDNFGNYFFKIATGTYDIIFQEGTANEVIEPAQAIGQTAELINDLSQTINFDDVAAYKAFAQLLPVTKRVYLADREAYFNVTSVTVGANDKDLIASTSVSQSIVLVVEDLLIASQWGAINDESTVNTPVIQAMIDSTQPTDMRNIYIDDGCRFSLVDLAFNNDVDIQYRANDELDSPSTFGQATNERVNYRNNDNNAGDVNEWQFSAALHPGIILDIREDTANRGAGSQVGLASHIIRKENINQWQWGRQEQGQFSITSWQYVYTLVGITTASFTILTPKAGDLIRGVTSLAEGHIISINGTETKVSWLNGIFQDGENVLLIPVPPGGSEVSSTTISSNSAGFTTRFNQIVVAPNGGGAGINIPTDNLVAAGLQFGVGGIAGIEDARGGVFGGAKAALKIFDDLAAPTIGIRTALNTVNDTFEVYDDQGVLLVEIAMDTGAMTVKGPVTSTVGGITPSSYTSAQLNDVAHPVNTVNKKVGMMVYNLQSDRPIWASGVGASDTWKYADGTVAHTPV